jgi:hypothetical protein
MSAQPEVDIIVGILLTKDGEHLRTDFIRKSAGIFDNLKFKHKHK